MKFDDIVHFTGGLQPRAIVRDRGPRGWPPATARSSSFYRVVLLLLLLLLSSQQTTRRVSPYIRNGNTFHRGLHAREIRRSLHAFVNLERYDTIRYDRGWQKRAQPLARCLALPAAPRFAVLNAPDGYLRLISADDIRSNDARGSGYVTEDRSTRSWDIAIISLFLVKQPSIHVLSVHLFCNLFLYTCI